MENLKTGQEKLIAALAAFVFFIPILTNVKTPFIIKYMKQGFIINLIELGLAIVGGILFFLIGIISLLNFICFFLSVWLAYNAFQWKEFVFPIILTQADSLIQKLSIGKWFSQN